MSEVADTLILIDYPWSCYFTEKRRHIRHLLATVRPPIFARHLFTIEDVSLHFWKNHETKRK